MKKLMITLSAAALAFGLYADGGPLAGEAFTGLTEVPATITTPGESSIGTTPFVQSQNEAGLPDQFAEAGKGENLVIKTKLDAPAYYKPTELAGGVTMNGLFFDSMVKFTACDEDAVVPTGSNAKIMVWVKEDETAGTTNLMVTAGYFADTDNTIEAKNYDCGPVADYDIDIEKWSRLTIKAYDEITTSGDKVGGFVLFVNAKTVTIAKDKAIGVAGSYADSLTKVLKLRTYAVFPSLAEPGTTTVTGVGFAGQGAVDDLSFTTKAPTTDGDTSFVDDPVPAIATVNGAEVADVAALNNAIAGDVGGAAVVLVDDVEGDIVFANGAAYTLDIGAFTLNGKVTVKGGSGCTLTISGTTGKIEDEVTIDEDEVITLASGKIKNSTNLDLIENVIPADGLEFVDCDEGAYKTVAATQEDGTAEKPWKINEAKDLTDKLLAKCTAGTAAENMNFVLTADIDMSTVVGPWDGPGESRTAEGAFTGVFDGQGHTIYNLTLAKKEYNGFFGNLAGAAQVKNLTIIITGFGGETPSNGSFGAGGVTGFAMGSNVIIENVTVKGTSNLSGTHNMAGIGARLEGTITLKNCTNELNIATSYSKIGGMCAIASNRDAAGNITFDGCVNKGSVTALENTDHNAGKDGCAGIIGYIQNDGGTDVPAKVLSIKNCQNLGVISTSDASNKSAKIASLLSYPQTCTFGDLTGNAVDASIVAVGNLAQVPPNLLFAANDAFVPTASLDKTGATQYDVMAAGAPVSLALGESIDLDETLATATVTAADAAANKIVKEGTVYTCVAKPAVTTVTLAAATVEYGTTVAPAATVKDADGTTIDAANYDLAYSPELTATTAVGTEITVTATAKGDDYVGSASAKFTVVAKAITVGVTINDKSADEADWSASLELPTPVITGVDGLTKDTDYTAAWDKELPKENPTENVVLTYTVTPIGNYSGESASATFTVKPASTPSEDWDKPVTPIVSGETKAADAWPSLKDTPLAQADAAKLAAWAKDTTKGNITFDKADEILVDAFLLDCANTDAAVATEKAAFKVTSITQDEKGDWVATVEGKGETEAYKNGFIHIVPYELEGAGDNAEFYQATLTLQPVVE